MADNIPSAVHPRLLQLIIFPTEKCNFRCTYCYESFEIGKMKRPVIDAVKRLIESRVERDTLDALTLSWFGGEPLLARDVMDEISSFANEFHERKAFSLSGDITTNGYLLDAATLSKLVKVRQSAFQISLDGYGAAHDATRRYASGKGTFDVIWRNLCAAHDSALQFSITLRCHLTRDNEASMIELTDKICERFGGDSRFNIFFKPIENLGGPNAAQISTVEKTAARGRVALMEAKLRAAGFSVNSVIEGPESAGSSSSATKVVLQPKESEVSSAGRNHRPFTGYICYAAKPNSLIIRADGSIGKCTVLLDDPRNKVGQLNTDGTVTIDSGLVSRVWMRGFVSRDEKELGCPAMNLPKLPKESVVKLDALRSSAGVSV
ncbi:radical SAM protein [Sinimarinibacterium flocculans]|uniref:radical SAM protein n=1 Tax=Sinimarinibacterium flocculans TaxID=985250 RepID=UPI0035180FDD